MAENPVEKWLEMSANLKLACGRNLSSLSAIRELADFAVEHVAKLDEKSSPTGFQVSGSPLGLDFIRSYASAIIEWGSNADSYDEIDAMQALEQHLEDYKLNLSEEDAAALDDLVVLERSRARTDLLLASLLIGAVSTFEVLFSSVAATFYHLRPEALRAQDAKISWSDIQAYTSLDDLKSRFVDERVSQLMWEGFDGWMRWLGSQLKIRFEDIALDPEGTAEVFQRRHIIVHNGGLVSAQYLSKVSGTVALAAMGSPLPVDIAYLESSLDKLSVIGTTISYMVLRKLCPTEAEHGSLDADISRLVFSLLRQRKWEVVQAVCAVLSSGMKRDYERRTVQVNKWVAQKRLKGKEAVAMEVSLWDVSALQPIFKLAQQTLMEDPSAIGLAEELLRSGELNQSKVSSWPLFEDVRDEINNRTVALKDKEEKLQGSGPGDDRLDPL